MPNDATFELLADLQNKEQADISLISQPTYNIDDMDPKFCMVDLIFTGCYCLRSSKTIDPTCPGMVYIDGTPTEAPVVPVMPMFGQMIGIHVRKYLHHYGRAYHIRYAGAIDTDGINIPEFSFDLTTDVRQEPGECWPEHDEVVLQAARESAVLLKNENHALPLGKGAAVNVFGSGSVVFHVGCLGAGKINPRYSIRVREGIEKYSSLRLNEELYQFYTAEKDELPPADLLEQARVLSDTAVVFIGRTSSEAHDTLPQKGGYYLTDSERALIAGVTSAFTKTVAVLNVAHPIETGWIDEYGVDAVLLVGLPGMMGGRALAEILEGTVNPSGKLPNTWAADYWDHPSAQNFLTLPDVRAKYLGAKFLTTVYEEGLYVGYRYFDTFGKKAAYLFGHGLSYTTFDMSVASVSPEGHGVRVEVTVTNTGSVPGKEVVQLYARLPEVSLEQPNERLVGFAKTEELAPGTSQTLTLEVGVNRLKSFDPVMSAWVVEAGEIALLLGGAPDRAVQIYRWTLLETLVIAQVKDFLRCPIQIRELSKGDPAGTYPTGALTKGWTGDTLPFPTSRNATSDAFELPRSAGALITFPDVKRNPSLAEAFIAQMSNYELARFSVGGKTGWGMGDTGFAGMLFNEGDLEKYQIPSYYFADGNNGLNLFAPNIGFPVSTTMCATWNEELSYQEGVAIAEEAKAQKLDCLLAPALNLQRNPLCGRHTEYFSEDPLLAGRMAGQESRGFEETGVSSCMKHFFANNAETMRNMNHSVMTQRTARELYLRAFEVAFEVHKPDTVMTGYNAANGVYCADDPELLQGILREEMGFDGFVMTDWNGYGDQGMDGALAAGIGWLAPGSTDDTLVIPIAEALDSGKLCRGQVQRQLAELVRVIVKHGKEEGQ